MVETAEQGSVGGQRSLTVVVPALNEEAVIAQTVAEITDQVERAFSEFEIILVDDGSSDATGAIMDRIAREHDRISVIHNGSNLGLGAAYRRGVDAARKEYLMMLCGDGGLPATSLPPIFAVIGKVDMVVPFMTNLKKIKSPLRYMLSRGYTWLMNLMFRQKLNYYNGLPVHRVAYLRQISITSSGFGFQGEILIKLLKAGCSYVQVGVQGAEVTKSSSALRPRNIISVFGTVWRLVWGLIRFKPPKLVRSDKAVSSEYSTGSGG